MNDMTKVIEPKSDQLNADDLIAGPRTITVREVTIRPGTEQPVSIFFEGDNGKPYKCCKSMARVLVSSWGPDASKYVGRSMTLYRDPTVKWAGMEVGGIRISHLSHIERETVMALTATKGSRKPFIVKPLSKAAKQEQRQEHPISVAASEAASKGLDAFRTFWKKLSQADRVALQPNMASYQERATLADEEKAAAQQQESEISDDPFENHNSEEPAEEQKQRATQTNRRAI